MLLCSPWQQAHKLAALPQVRGLRHVRLAQTGCTSGFWRVPPHDGSSAGTHLASIEALTRLLHEFTLARRGVEGGGEKSVGGGHGGGVSEGGSGGENGKGGGQGEGGGEEGVGEGGGGEGAGGEGGGEGGGGEGGEGECGRRGRRKLASTWLRSARLRAGEGLSSGWLDELLFFFRVIQSRVVQHRGGHNSRCGPSGPLTDEGREAFRAAKSQRVGEGRRRSNLLRQRYGSELPAESGEAEPGAEREDQS